LSPDSDIVVENKPVSPAGRKKQPLDTEPVEIEIDPQLRQKIRARIKAKKRIILRLDRNQITAAKNIAAANGIPCKALFQKWLVEGIKKERGKWL